MSAQERITSQHDREQTSPELLAEAAEQHERLREQHEHKEKTAEKDHESAESLHEQAHELAHEKESTDNENEAAPHEKADDRPVTRARRDKAYQAIMEETRTHMSPASRTFSKVIHVPVVEKVSDVAGKTVARPNAILAGSFTAFATVLVVFLIARHYGYALSGSETIAAFAAGWVLGIVYDFLKVMITGRK